MFSGLRRNGHTDFPGVQFGASPLKAFSALLRRSASPASSRSRAARTPLRFGRISVHGSNRMDNLLKAHKLSPDGGSDATSPPFPLPHPTGRQALGRFFCFPRLTAENLLTCWEEMVYNSDFQERHREPGPPGRSAGTSYFGAALRLRGDDGDDVRREMAPQRVEKARFVRRNGAGRNGLRRHLRWVSEVERCRAFAPRRRLQELRKGGGKALICRARVKFCSAGSTRSLQPRGSSGASTKADRRLTRSGEDADEVAPTGIRHRLVARHAARRHVLQVGLHGRVDQVLLRLRGRSIPFVFGFDPARRSFSTHC